MQSGIYVSLSSQLALDRRLTTIADNVANVNTVGFRATEVKFEDLVSGLGEQSVAFVSPGETYMPQQHGAMRETGNSFDFAVKGDAWFSIETPAGPVMTRDGRFTMLPTGELVSIEGYPVLDAGGAPLVLDPQGGAPEVGADGALHQDGQQIGAIGLFQFQPGVNFTRYGNSGIVPFGQPEPIVDRVDVGIAQGFVEESNVNPVLEITKLIQLQRTFEYVTSLIKDSENALDRAIDTLGPR